MLEVREVTKSYDDRIVVDRVSFAVHPGEIFALLGPNGAGKTTLIRMITDILKPDSGTVELDGRPVQGEEKRRIAYLPEERGIYRREKALDILSYYGRLKGLPGPAARAAALALLDRVELREWAQKQAQTLSKGMQQKLQICTALIGDPSLLILDEPFSGLDPVNVQLLESILFERRAMGVTILLSTHQMNKVEQLCDRALMLNRGQRVLFGTLQEIRRRHSDHAVVVRSGGRIEAVPGVVEVQPMNGSRPFTPSPEGASSSPGADDPAPHGGAFKLILAPDATPQSVLRALLDRGVEIESFEISSLPLEDIFVKVALEDPGRGPNEESPAAASTRRGATR